MLPSNATIQNDTGSLSKYFEKWLTNIEEMAKKSNNGLQDIREKQLPELKDRLFEKLELHREVTSKEIGQLRVDTSIDISHLKDEVIALRSDVRESKNVTTIKLEDFEKRLVVVAKTKEESTDVIVSRWKFWAALVPLVMGALAGLWELIKSFVTHSTK